MKLSWLFMFILSVFPFVTFFLDSIFVFDHLLSLSVIISVELHESNKFSIWKIGTLWVNFFFERGSPIDIHMTLVRSSGRTATSLAVVIVLAVSVAKDLCRCAPWGDLDLLPSPSPLSSREEFYWKLIVGIPRTRGLLDSPWQPLGIPSAITPISQLHQSLPSFHLRVEFLIENW